MKIETQEAGFTPVVITLESEAELALIWHSLNVGAVKQREKASEYVERYQTERMSISGCDSYDMWNMIDEVCLARGMR